MHISFIGLGKLGLPCAVSVAMKGHDVKGYDLSSHRMSHSPQPYQEAGPDGTGDFNDYLAKADTLSFGTMDEVAEFGDIIFLAVQTPHDARYEGISRIPEERVDFDYSYLAEASRLLAQSLKEKKIPTVLAIISTCLPGNVRKHILPLFKNLPLVSIAYNPFFIAMGTTMRDFIDPEFVLLGGDEDEQSRSALDTVEEFYHTIHRAPIARMSIESAELTKVCYNTYISFKIAFANTVMEICHNFPEADCDEVVDALSMAHRRIIAPTYMRGGMGDGGGCHPRDNIAMSHLAKDIPLSFDLFEAEMLCREKQAEWLADMLIKLELEYRLPVVILGTAFKPESNLVVGSPALLVASLLREKGCISSALDEHVTNLPDKYNLAEPSVVLIGCRHPEYASYQFPKGSIVVDPFRYIPEQEEVRVIHIGKKENRRIL